MVGSNSHDPSNPDFVEKAEIPDDIFTTRVANRAKVVILFSRHAFFEGVPTQMSFIRSVGLDKKSCTLFGPP